MERPSQTCGQNIAGAFDENSIGLKKYEDMDTKK